MLNYRINWPVKGIVEILLARAIRLHLQHTDRTTHFYAPDIPEPDGTDPFHREPYIASFKELGGNFDATFIIIHTDPDEADFIVMGDLNADGSYFDENGGSTLSSSEYYWVIDDSVDTTTKSTDYTYDRIIVTDSAVSDLSGDSGVYRFDIEYGLTVEETVAVSDHYPVFAEYWCGKDTY